LAGFLGAQERIGGRAIPLRRELTHQNRLYRPAGTELDSAQLSAGKKLHPHLLCNGRGASVQSLFLLS
jgi:hypothetical protein